MDLAGGSSSPVDNKSSLSSSFSCFSSPSDLKMMSGFNHSSAANGESHKSNASGGQHGSGGSGSANASSVSGLMFAAAGFAAGSSFPACSVAGKPREGSHSPVNNNGNAFAIPASVSPASSTSSASSSSCSTPALPTSSAYGSLPPALTPHQSAGGQQQNSGGASASSYSYGGSTPTAADYSAAAVAAYGAAGFHSAVHHHSHAHHQQSGSMFSAKSLHHHHHQSARPRTKTRSSAGKQKFTNKWPFKKFFLTTPPPCPNKKTKNKKTNLTHLDDYSFKQHFKLICFLFFFNVGLNNIPVKYSNWALLGFIFDIPAAYIYIIYFYCWWWIGA